MLFGYASIANADGGIFVPPDYNVFETKQQAFIYYHDKIEDLAIMTSYQGNAKDFTWVVPTPSKPEVVKTSSTLFANLDKLTNTYEYSGDVTTSFGVAKDSNQTEAVTVIEKKTIDMYDTTILKADNEKALFNWMKDNGYNFPEEQSYLLSDYTDNGWFFVISKIRPDLIDNEKVSGQLYDGNITPLRLTFATDKIIYPMKLTNLSHNYQKTLYQNYNSTSWRSDIGTNIYVLSDQKTKLNNFTVQYANWVKPDKLTDLVDTATEKDWISTDKKLFLTKFYNYNSSSFSEDLLIRNEINNKIVPTPYYQEPGYISSIIIAFFITLLAYLLMPIFSINIIMYCVSRIKNNYSIFYFSQLIATLLTIITTILVSSTLSGYGIYVYDYHSFDFMNIVEEGTFLGIFISLVLITIFMIVFSIKMIFGRNIQKRS